jgi:excisionase family DNA binding protein
MNTKQAGEYLGVADSRIRQLISAGGIRAEKIGRDWLIRQSELDRYRATQAERNAKGKRGRPFRV